MIDPTEFLQSINDFTNNVLSDKNNITFCYSGIGDIYSFINLISVLEEFEHTDFINIDNNGYFIRLEKNNEYSHYVVLIQLEKDENEENYYIFTFFNKCITLNCNNFEANCALGVMLKKIIAMSEKEFYTHINKCFPTCI